MKLLNLEIEAFMAIDKATINLDSRGLVVIQGVNKDDTSADSNGAGKSSIADAIDWVLYGETARGISGDDVVNNTLSKGTRVAITLQDGLNGYTIARHRKHKAFKNSLTLTHSDGFKETDLTKGTDALTQEEVRKIVGSSHSVFRASIYAGQEQMPDLPSMTDKHLKILIEEAAGSAVLEGAYKATREHATHIQNRILLSSNLIEGLERGAAFKVQEIENYKNSSTAFEADRKTKIDSLKTRAGDTIKAAGDLLTLMNAIMDETTLAKAISDEDAKISAVDGERIEAQRLNSVVVRAKAELAEAERRYAEARIRTENAKTALDNIAHKVGCPCDACGRPLTAAELADVTAKAKSDYELAADNLLKAKELVEKLTAAASDAQKAFDTHTTSLTDISLVTARRSELLVEQRKFAELKAKRDATLREAQLIRDQITQISQSENPFVKSIETAKEQLEKIKDDIATAKDSHAILEEEAAIEAEVVKIFSPVGVRAHILDEITPYLNAQTSAYLSTLSDGNIEAVWSTVQYNKKGEAKERFAIDVSKKRGSGKFGGLSGGEKRKVRLATAMALQDLVATRATKPISLFIADEIDDALDKAGLERLMAILEEKAKERGSVFIISHNDLKDWISSSITVTMDGGLATVTEVSE